jgi:type I restriction enzyme, S subunit
MKDSGVSWLGMVPEHWDILPALAVYKPRQVKNIGMRESTVLSLSYGRIVVKPAEKLRGLVPESFETYQIVDPGNIIIRTTDLQNDQTSLRIGISPTRGIITSAYLCLENTDRVSNLFAYQYLNAYDLLKIIYGFGSGLRQNLDFQAIKRMPVLVPPPFEQAAIVRFLDHVDGCIRRYIRAKQTLIKLLEEEKQVITQHAVMGGLDQNRRVRPSGTEWLRDVPEHWQVRRGKYLFHEIENRSTTGHEVLLSLRMYSGLIAHNDVSNVPITPKALIGFKKVAPGQIVMNRMRAAIGMFGVADQPGLVSPDYAVLEPVAEVEPAYFVRLFKTPAACVAFRAESKGLGTGSSGFMRLYTDRFGTIKFPVPPREEQLEILRSITGDLQEIEQQQKRVMHEIVLLREYRTRLIADVVTGKLDVREASVPVQDERAEKEGFDNVIEEDPTNDVDETLETVEA